MFFAIIFFKKNHIVIKTKIIVAAHFDVYEGAVDSEGEQDSPEDDGAAQGKKEEAVEEEGLEESVFLVKVGIPSGTIEGHFVVSSPHRFCRWPFCFC